MNIRLWFLLVAVLSSVAPASAQSGKRKVTDPPEILKIRAQFKAINAKKKYTIRKREVPDEHHIISCTGYYDGKNLRKIAVNDGGDHGYSVEEYYYQNGKLIFVYSKSIYDLFGPPRVQSEDRYYFIGDRMIRWLSKDNIANGTDTAEATQTAKYCLDESRKYVALLNKPKR